MLNAPRQSSSFTLAPEGTHIARCYQLLEVGTVDELYMGEPKHVSKIRLTFELPEETKEFKAGEGEKPIVISQEYTLSMAPLAKLRKLIEGMIGTSLSDAEANAFNVEDLVGMPCLVTIVHKTSAKGSDYAIIASTSALMKNQKAPAQVNPSRIATYEKWDQDFFASQPDFIKDKMKTSDEYKRKFEPMTEYDKKKLADAKKFVSDADSIDPDSIPF